jgi:hypothetical protein
MQYPEDHEPLWIDWTGSPDGGFRFITYTDAEAEPFIGCVRLDPLGSMKTEPGYSRRPMSSWYHTELFHRPTGELQIYRFVVRVTGYGLSVRVNRVPSDGSPAEERAVSWVSENPTVSF